MLIKKIYAHTKVAFLLCLLTVGVQSQKIKTQKGSFSIDNTNNIIVWHQSNIDSVLEVNPSIRSFKFEKNYKVVDTLTTLSYSKNHKISRKGKLFSLYITKLPIVQLNVETALNNRTKVLGHYTYYDNKGLIKSGVGIEYRGNLSLTYPKKTFDLEFWSDSIKNKSKDLKFKNLRDDDDWILDGLYNEPLRIRSFIATKLWTAIQKPHYQSNEPLAESGTDVIFVEVFKNQKYHGLYALSESVDRKLLNLKRNKSQIINGELFKASSYEGAPAFKKAPEFNNLFPHWGGFEMIYPVVDYKSNWSNLAELVNLVVNGTDEEFTQEIENRLEINNVIDYFLFINLLRATDNLGKNYYLARYDKDGPYFFVPWDLDGVMGIIQDGKRISTTDDILSNGLFDRLLKVDPNAYREKLKLRWIALRESEFSNINLFDTIEVLYSKLRIEKLYEREYKVWPNERTVEEEYIYLQSWLEKRLIYLDSHFKNL